VKTSGVTLGLVQMSMGDDAAANLRKALSLIGEAAGKRAQIVCLPELFLGPYFCQRPDNEAAFERAEAIPGPTTQALSDAARAHNIVLIGGSVFERAADGRFYNTSPVFGPEGGMLGTYRKTHIPEDILYHEQHYFSPGDTGVRVFETPFGKIAPLICYDQWYPEAARIAALKGAELIVYPTAIGTIDTSVEENITGNWEQMWRSAQLGHAAANNVYVAAVNRTGKEADIHFWGGSFVADPSGALIAQADDMEGVWTTVCDFSRVKALQKAWRFLENRRPESYGELTRGQR
jgi:predicted amidohydrolase